MEKYRMETFWDKEPEMIEWIKSFEPQNTFFDIGANIGIYSLYAASLYPEMKIFAFEPVRCNFIRLMQNIELNDFKNITAFPFGAGNRNSIKQISLISKEIGHSGSQIANQGDYDILVITIDTMNLWKIFPNYIKIDIDGLELQVLQGALDVISDKIPDSILIEINKDSEDIIYALDMNGYTINNRFNKLKNHSRIRRAKEGIKAENVIFTKK